MSAESTNQTPGGLRSRALPGSAGRVYAPNGVIYENGHAVGFYDTAESLGIMTDEDLAEAQALIADLAVRRKNLEAAGQWNPVQNETSPSVGAKGKPMP